MKTFLAYLFLVFHLSLFVCFFFPIGVLLGGFNLLLMDLHNQKKSFSNLQGITVCPLWDFWLNVMENVLRKLGKVV